MQLFTAAIEAQLQEQYLLANNLGKTSRPLQNLQSRGDRPYGHGTWHLINQDPEDPNYLYCIAKLYEVEVGSVLKSKLTEIRLTPAQLPLERDLYFKPVNAQTALDRLLAREHL